MLRSMARWVNEHGLPTMTGILLTADTLAGLNWLLAPASSLSSPIYSIARLPMKAYGLAFLVLGIAGTVSYLTRRRVSTAVLLGPLLGGLWLYWTILFVLVPLGRPGASYLGAITAGTFCALHYLSSLGVLRHDERK